MVYLTNFNEGKQKEDIKKSGGVYLDTYREFSYMWNPNKKKRMDSRIPFVASRKSGLSPYDMNWVLIGQVNWCNMRCWYCFVDDKNKDGSLGIKKSTDQIISEVVPYLDEHEKFNAFRISGGEPSYRPRFLYEMIEKFPQDYGLYIDTNLTKRLHKDELINQNNVQFQMCVKGITASNFSENCDLPESMWDTQLKNLDYMENTLDDYSIYLLDLIQDKEDLESLDYLFERIKNPEKVEVLQIALYGPTFDRLENKGIKVPEFEPYTLQNAWSNMLKESKGKDYTKCLILE